MYLERINHAVAAEITDVRKRTPDDAMTWNLTGNEATLAEHALTASVTLDRPHGGLRRVSVPGQVFSVENLLAVRVPSRPDADSPTEAYVRGRDLVIKYPPRDSDRVSHQIYYRVLHQPAGIELVLSAQTDLLDSDPWMHVDVMGLGAGAKFVHMAESLVPVDRSMTWQASQPSVPRFFLFRPDASAVSHVTFVHPQDFDRAEVLGDGIRFTVFPESLEKGVIRRASFQWRLLERDGDVEQANRLYEQAMIAAPPLTT